MAEIKIGEFNSDGSIKIDVRTSVLSGKRTEPGDPMIGIPNTRYFYRLEAQELRLLYDETDPQLAAQRRADLDNVLADAVRSINPPAPARPLPTKEDKGVISG